MVETRKQKEAGASSTAKNKISIKKIKPEEIKLDITLKKDPKLASKAAQKDEEDEEPVLNFQNFVDSNISKLNVDDLFLSSSQRPETIDDTVSTGTTPTNPEPVQNVEYTAGGQRYTNVSQQRETRPGYGETESRAGYPRAREFTELREGINAGNTTVRNRLPFVNPESQDQNVPTNQFEGFAQEQQKYQEAREDDSRLPFQPRSRRRQNF